MTTLTPPPPEHPERPGALPAAPSGGAALPPWQWWMPFAVLLLTLIAASLIFVILAAIAGADAGDPPPGVSMVATFAQDVLLVVGAVLLGALAIRPTAAQYGLRPTRLWRAVGIVLLAYIGFIVFAAGYQAIFDITAEEDLADDLGVKDSTAALVAAAILVTIVAPIVEEVFFRGFMFTTLRRSLGVVAAALLTGVMFGLVHAGSSPSAFLVPLGIFGALLCFVYWRTGSLYPCIALHAVNNSIAFGATVDWDWQIPLLLAGSLATLSLIAVYAPRARPLA